MAIPNVYHDPRRADSYASIGIEGTYYLAFRDLPEILAAHVSGRRALDFGCGAGRSTRFLKQLGFDALGADVSESMLAIARRRDPGGVYHHIADGDLRALEPGGFDLVLCAFPFDNIAGDDRRAGIMRGLARLLAPGGCVVLVASTPELYLHEWLSFTTAAFPANREARSGDTVYIVIDDIGGDARPIPDLLWRHEDYVALLEGAGLSVRAVERPLGRDGDPYEWVSERTVAPWAIYVAVREGRSPEDAERPS